MTGVALRRRDIAGNNDNPPTVKGLS